MSSLVRPHLPFMADESRALSPRGCESHWEAAISCRRSVGPRWSCDAPQSTTPTPRGGEELRPAVSREPAGICRLPITVGTDVPEQSTMHRLMTTCSAFRDPTTPFLSRWRGRHWPYPWIHASDPRRFRADLATTL